mmetsp:Transcript_54175/g.86129  ORF Transcript_54175/g.86129 Transcript_54175/m.86129 type:complete len:197 (-) Transcript_54175:10-600(-)
MAVAFRPPARRITVRCKIAGGAQFELDVDPGTTVGSMKRTLGRKLAERGCEVCSEHVRLIVKGKFLGDDSIVRECQVVPGCKMLLMRDAILPSDSSGSEAAATASLDVVREYEVTPEELDLQAQQEPVCLQEDTSHCWTCSKHIGLTGITCRCGYTFCSQHRYAECHDCQFNHQKFHRENLEKQMLGCVADKVKAC